MLAKLALSVVVAVVVTLGCILLGAILISLKVDVAVTVGNFIHSYGGVIGVLSGIWYYFSR